MKSITVKYQNGQSESITTPPLSNSELYQFVDLLVTGKTPEIIGLCARRNLAWVNSLTLECFADLAAAFVKENFSKAMVIMNKDPIAAMKFYPTLKTMQIILAEQFDSGIGTNFAPTPDDSATAGSDSPQTPPPEDAAAKTPAPSAT